jgi:hypothetical protein
MAAGNTLRGTQATAMSKSKLPDDQSSASRIAHTPLKRKKFELGRGESESGSIRRFRPIFPPGSPPSPDVFYQGKTVALPQHEVVAHRVSL